MYLLKRRVWMIIVVHKTMLAHAIATNFIQNFTHSLKCRLSVMNAPRDLFSGLHESTEHAPSLRIWRTSSVIILVPSLQIGKKFY